VNTILMLPAVSPVALFVAHELLPAVRFLAGAVRGRR
jgi:hypothetical protein